MLRWFARIVKQRWDRGRVVLLENGWTSEVFNEPEIIDLEEYPDRQFDSSFGWFKGDQ